MLSKHLEDGRNQIEMIERKALPGIATFVTGVTTAAVGAISGAVIVLGQRSIIDIPTALFALITLGLLWKSKRVSEPIIVLGAAIIGLIVYPMVQ